MRVGICTYIRHREKDKHNVQNVVLSGITPQEEREGREGCAEGEEVCG